MKSDAVKQARRRLEKAEAAVKLLADAKTIEATRLAWSDFLLATAAIYTKLQRGIARKGEEREWFDAVIQERETDELLKYIYEARNVDEHGIVEVTGDKGLFISRVMPDGTRSGLHLDNPADVELTKFETYVINPDGSETPWVTELTIEQEATMVPIVDDRNGRKGRIYPVPTSHMGNMIHCLNSYVTATWAMPYFRNLLVAADHFECENEIAKPE